MASPIFRITDGKTSVNLITKYGSGINTMEYTPGRMLFKDDGIWADSSLSDGRQLQMRKLTNAVDILTLGISGGNQDEIIDSARKLTMLLEKAVSYFITEWQNEPVWIERRGSNEKNTAYTLIYSYRWNNDVNPFAPPFFTLSKPSAQVGFELSIEHGAWMSNPPGESDCLRISNIMLGVIDETSAEPEQSDDDVFVSSNRTMNIGGNYLQLYRDANESRGIGIRFRNVNIPQGSIISNASIKFKNTAKAITNNLKVELRGQVDKRVWSDISPRNYNWATSSMSSNGHYILVGSIKNDNDLEGRLYLSKDMGLSFAEVRPDGDNDYDWTYSAMSLTGQYMLVGNEQGVYRSSDYGDTWSVTTLGGLEDGGAMATNGQYALVGYTGERLYRSTDYGATWAQITPAGSNDIDWTAATANGQYMVVAGDDKLYRSTNNGGSWSDITPSVSVDRWTDVSISSNGNVIVAIAGILMSVTKNGASSWTNNTYNNEWSSLAMSSDGTTIFAVPGRGGSGVYKSTDSGDSWTLETYTENFSIQEPYKNFVNIHVSGDAYTMFMVSVKRKLPMPSLSYVIPDLGEIYWFGQIAALPAEWDVDANASDMLIMGADVGGATNVSAGSDTHSHTYASGTGTAGGHKHNISHNGLGSASGGGVSHYETANNYSAKSGHTHSGGTGETNIAGAHAHSLSATQSALALPPYNRLYVIKANQDAAVPVGGIILWTKNKDVIPEGFALCDGDNDTVDLSDRFVKVATSDLEIGTKDGSETHRHVNNNTGGAGAHSHTGSLGSGTSVGDRDASGYSAGVSLSAQHSHKFNITTNTDTAHTHTISDTGAGNLLPPYIYLYYIQRME